MSKHPLWLRGTIVWQWVHLDCALCKIERGRMVGMEGRREIGRKGTEGGKMRGRERDSEIGREGREGREGKDQGRERVKGEVCKGGRRAATKLNELNSWT